MTEISKEQVEFLRNAISVVSYSGDDEKERAANETISVIISIADRLASGEWVMVPKEPTEAMIEQAAKAITDEVDFGAWDRILKTSVLPYDTQATAKLGKQRRLARAALRAILSQAESTKLKSPDPVKERG